MWRAFFAGVGAEVVVSRPTDKAILGQGVEAALEEVCLPVKVFFGHVLDLRGRVDLVFVPRIVSVEPRAYTCPKLLGLPDMVRAALPDLPPLLAPTVNLTRDRRSALKAAFAVGRRFTANPVRIAQAYRDSLAQQARFRALTQAGLTATEALAALDGREQRPGDADADLTLAALGHGYTIHDRYVTMDLLRRLARLNVRVLTPEMAPEAEVRRQAARLRKPLFWTYEREIVGAAYYYADRPEVDGLINVASFECGPDSMVDELIVQHLHGQPRAVPLLHLTLDEHSGEAGLVTRLEAFTDMIRWRRQRMQAT
jgi:predicted nucleotide-binding protein (sugar kinase/HSP70/actin superfamily)